MEDYDERLERSFCIFPEEHEIPRKDFCELSETQSSSDEYPDKLDDVDLSDFSLVESETIIYVSMKFGMTYSDVIYHSHKCTQCVNKLCLWNNGCDGLNN
jgi:hypothetical protein